MSNCVECGNDLANPESDVSMCGDCVMEISTMRASLEYLEHEIRETCKAFKANEWTAVDVANWLTRMAAELGTDGGR